MASHTETTAIPRVLETYPTAADQSLAAELSARAALEPFNAIATGIFILAILHTFAAARSSALAHRVQHRHDERVEAQGRPPSPSLRAELLHFLGEVEVVFGVWAAALLVATRRTRDGSRLITEAAAMTISALLLSR